MHYYAGIVVPVSGILPIGAGVYTYRQLEKPHKIILFYLVFAGISEAVSSYTSHHRINNLWLLHIYTAIETVLLLWFYKEALRDTFIKKVIPWLMVLFPIVCAVNFIWGQGFHRLNTYTRPVEALILMFMGIVYFLERSHDPDSPRRGPVAAMTWINIGLLFYMAAAFFIFIFYNFINQGQAFADFIAICQATFVLIMHLLIMIGFLKCRN